MARYILENEEDDSQLNLSDEEFGNEIMAIRVPHTENLTQGELTDRDAEGEPEEMTAGLPQEMPGRTSSNVLVTPQPGPARAEGTIDTENAALEERRNRWSLHPSVAPSMGDEEEETESRIRPRRRGPRSQRGRDVTHLVPPNPRTRNLAGLDLDEGGRLLSFPPGRPQRWPSHTAPGLPGVSESPIGLGACAAATPMKRPSTQADQDEARTRIAELEDDLKSKWHDEKGKKANRQQVRKQMKIVNGGNVGSPTPSLSPPGPPRKKGGRPKKVPQQPPPSRHTRPAPEMDVKGYKPGEKEEQERLRRLRKRQPVTDKLGNILGYKTPDSEEEEEEVQPPPAKKPRRGRGPKKGDKDEK
ncbi:MAG: hypothetical protein Q9218_004497 [Villophora microphyllina]